MSESISEVLKRIASGLHWLGKYSESAMLYSLSMYCLRKDLHTVEDLDAAKKEN